MKFLEDSDLYWEFERHCSKVNGTGFDGPKSIPSRRFDKKWSDLVTEFQKPKGLPYQILWISSKFHNYFSNREFWEIVFQSILIIGTIGTKSKVMETVGTTDMPLVGLAEPSQLPRSPNKWDISPRMVRLRAGSSQTEEAPFSHPEKCVPKICRQNLI